MERNEKWLIASDLHGSAYWCKKLMEQIEAEKPKKVILLGDLLYHGPRNDLPKEYDPKQVAAMLNEKKDMLLCVRGNCEAEVDQMMLSFPVLAEYAYLWNGRIGIFATHGHHYHCNALPPLTEGELLLYGHTHVPLFEKKNGIYCVNPGSVSIPKENSPHSCLILEDCVLSWKDLEGGVYRKEEIKQ